jgi:ATP-dependent Clp protease ATP-binding subunit ClpA
MITPLYLRVWIHAKAAARRLRHPVLTSEHLFYACLRLHQHRHWDICRGLPVTAESVWLDLQQNPRVEESEDFSGVPLGISAKSALERAESDASQHSHTFTGAENLMRALLSESAGPVRSLLDSMANARHP